MDGVLGRWAGQEGSHFRRPGSSYLFSITGEYARLVWGELVGRWHDLLFGTRGWDFKSSGYRWNTCTDHDKRCRTWRVACFAASASRRQRRDVYVSAEQQLGPRPY